MAYPHPWQAFMNNELELLRIFRMAAEHNSFREVAVRLGASPQAVTRAIQRLERHFGELLFHRNTRQVRITAFGEGLLERVRPALEQFDEVWRAPDVGQEVGVGGTVRVSAPYSLGNRAVLPTLERVAAQHLGITLDVRLSDRLSAVVEEQIDVGIRVGFLRDSRFVARQAGRMRLPVVAAPSLIARVGAPERVEDLAGLPVCASLDVNTGRPWPWYFKAGRQWAPTSQVFAADDADMEMGAALAGVGFAQLADYMVAPHIASGKLVQVLAQEEPTPWGLYVYRPQRGPVPARVRVVFDALHEAVGALPRLG